MIDHYILDHLNNPIKADLMKWAEWVRVTPMERRRVAHDELADGKVRVSTVFLGLDHQFFGGPPHIFETMIFGGPHDQYQERYSTWAEAEAGHARALAIARGERDE